MRFKSIFWLFNAVVVAALMIFAVASFFLFGKEYATIYWGNMWIIAVLFIVLIGVLDTYFIMNWKLFDFLEKEDWPALLAWLEDRLYGKGKLKKPYANLLINTALSVSNFEAVKKLEKEIREKRPALLPSLGVSLGIPVLLEQDWQSVGAYYGPLADNPKTKRRDWAQWCRALAAGKEGIPEFVDLLGGKDPSIRILSCHLLTQYAEELTKFQEEKTAEARQELKTQLSGTAGERLFQRSKEEHLMAVVLASRVNQARDELFMDEA